MPPYASFVYLCYVVNSGRCRKIQIQGKLSHEKRKKKKKLILKRSLGIDFFPKISFMNVWFLQIVRFELPQIANYTRYHSDYRYFVKVAFFSQEAFILWLCTVSSLFLAIPYNVFYCSANNFELHLCFRRPLTCFCKLQLEHGCIQMEEFCIWKSLS